MPTELLHALQQQQQQVCSAAARLRWSIPALFGGQLAQLIKFLGLRWLLHPREQQQQQQEQEQQQQQAEPLDVPVVRLDETRERREGGDFCGSEGRPCAKSSISSSDASSSSNSSSSRRLLVCRWSEQAAWACRFLRDISFDPEIEGLSLAAVPAVLTVSLPPFDVSFPPAAAAAAAAASVAAAVLLLLFVCSSENPMRPLMPGETRSGIEGSCILFLQRVAKLAAAAAAAAAKASASAATPSAAAAEPACPRCNQTLSLSLSSNSSSSSSNSSSNSSSKDREDAPLGPAAAAATEGELLLLLPVAASAAARAAAAGCSSPTKRLSLAAARPACRWASTGIPGLEETPAAAAVAGTAAAATAAEAGWRVASLSPLLPLHSPKPLTVLCYPPAAYAATAEAEALSSAVSNLRCSIKPQRQHQQQKQQQQHQQQHQQLIAGVGVFCVSEETDAYRRPRLHSTSHTLTLWCMKAGHA
ncbi:hypothetical protein ACSSS7_006808 [Eimeria intestinalis]